jgi:glycosyltransferase involved in cell wall biosynthesis
MKINDLSLIIPCYNEEKIFQDSLAEIEFVLKNSRLKYEIIFVDDFSHDKTRDLILQACAIKKNYKYLFHEKNFGRGKSVMDGIRTSNGKIVGYMDIDCEVSPVYIPYFVKKLLDSNYDILTGKRIYREKLKSLHRSILSRGYSFLVKRLLKIPLSDTETGYKFFKTARIIRVIKKTKSHGWFWDTEIMAYAVFAKLNILEVPVLFVRRSDKESSVNSLTDSLRYLKNIMEFYLKLRKFNKPHD